IRRWSRPFSPRACGEPKGWRNSARFWQARPELASTDGLSGPGAGCTAGDADLVRGADHELAAGEFLDNVGIAGTNQRDAMLEAMAGVLGLGEALLVDAEAGLDVGKRDEAALAPDRVVAEIGHDREADRRQDREGKGAGDAALDSHA